MAPQAPHLALLHYNDLRHLADTLLLLPACFGTDLAPLLAEGPAAQRQAQQEQEQEQASAGIGSDGKLSFLADVALLRKAADDVMGQQVGSGGWVSKRAFALKCAYVQFEPRPVRGSIVALHVACCG